MKPKITEQDYIDAAKTLNVEIAMVKAFAKKEARSSGFITATEPRILFERHKFHNKTGGKFSKDHPDISNKTPGGYGKEADQHKRLQKASTLNRNAALESASWGLFQIMGENWKSLGYPTLQAFINAMYESEAKQLDAFVRFIKVNKIDVDMRNKNFKNIARKYNGPNYAINNYDKDLEKYYKQFGGKI
ncbi:N-acetylmuramidase family protein [Empedobacter stercoris]|uniref:N-acetylmuramidase family protein n=1 Tax=Empedobacter stercoris TaxID=1628248 RepID=UPI001CE0E583|nr:N-acetylmuramidase family protein [Empedobacter stercoris]MCA4782119.1 N-acetylmuramidase family protein [Empedobacter stercoris]